MRVSFSQYFLTDIERIDNIIMIDKCRVYDNEYNPEVIVHDKKVQACIIGVEISECEKLDFYYGSSLAFSIDNQGALIKLNPDRTIFEFQLPVTPKAEISCPWLTDDTKFLESIGTNLGNSLYKNIEVSGDSLVWKESLEKYIVDSGLQDTHGYDIERLDTKTGCLEERPIRFKSYSDINIIRGSWEIDKIKKTKREKQNVYNKISSSSFLVWDSPMSDAKINTSVSPECINRVGEYVDPNNIVFGNTDCFQYINFFSGIVGFKILGSVGSEVEFLFNKESINGNYTRFKCVVGEDGTGEITIPELEYYHLNGVIASKPTKLTEIDVITYVDEYVDYYIPNPDKTYIASINTNCDIKINGVCNYIEYEKYLGEIKEIGRGVESINSIPLIELVMVESGGLNSVVDNLEKSVRVSTDEVFFNMLYVIYQVRIKNNIIVEDNTITTSSLISDYKIKIEMTGKTWEISNIPSYIDEEGFGIFLLEKEINSKIDLEFRTDRLYENEAADFYYCLHLDFPTEFTNVFSTRSLDDEETVGDSSIDLKIAYRETDSITGKDWDVYGVEIRTNSENNSTDWRPRNNNDPIKITPIFLKKSKSDGSILESIILDSISFSVIQLSLNSNLEIWEETFPGEFTRVYTEINLYDSLEKRFIVVSPTLPNDISNIDHNWYYYDFNESNKFYITDTEVQLRSTGIIYYDKSGGYYEGLIKLGNEDLSKYCRLVTISRSDLVENLGTITATELSTYPRSWKDLLNSNTVNVGVIREPTEIKIEVGPSENFLKNEDYTFMLSGENAVIGIFGLYVRSNFKYTMRANENGYLRFVDHEGSTYNMSSVKNRFTDFSSPKLYNIVLTKLDKVSGGLENSYIEISSGSVTRLVKINISNPYISHEYFESDVLSNILKIYPNGTSSISNENIVYKTTTTPKLEYTGFSYFIINSSDIGFKGDIEYEKSIDIISFNIQNSISVSQSKFPMKSFGSIKELSLSYSSQESSPLVYPFYVKGREHFLWCVDSLNDFSSLVDPEIPSEDHKVTVDNNFYIDATGEEGKDFYIVSRYGIGNKTFITEYPDKDEIKISSGNREIDIKISPQQKISLDSRSQIEYSIPINVSCKIENNGGNIFLGSLEYKAITEITDNSVNDVIELNLPITGIDKNYIESNIVSSKEEVLSLKFFQRGTDQNIFDLYSMITDFGIEEDTKYVVPEVGSNIRITDLNYELNESGGGSTEGFSITSEYSPEYFLITAHCDSRIKSDNHWFSKYDFSTLSKNNIYNLRINVSYNEVGNPENKTKIFENSFTRFGCNYGFYANTLNPSIDKCCGFGKTETSDNSPQIFVTAVGSLGTIKAGIFYASDGLSNTETLLVPNKYEFIGDNIAEIRDWSVGKLDDSNGNLVLIFPERIRGEHGDKHYILHISHDVDYYPIDLYVDFVQMPWEEE